MAGIAQPNVIPGQFSGGAGYGNYRSPLMHGRVPVYGTGIAQGIDNLAAALVGPSPAADALTEDRLAQADLRRQQLAMGVEKLNAAKDAKTAEAQVPQNVLEGLFPGRGKDVLAYRAAGGETAPPVPLDDEGNAFPKVPMERPQGYTPQVEPGVNNLMAVLGMLTGQVKNPEQITKGAGELQQQDIIRKAVESLQNPAAGPYVAKGGAPYHFGAQGDVGNMTTGTTDQTSPLAQAKIGLEGAQTTQATAAAGASQAHARLFDRTTPSSGTPRPPIGFRYSADGQSLEAIPGGPADTKRAGQLSQDQMTMDNLTTNMDRLATAATTLMQHPGIRKAVGPMSIVPGVGGTLTMPGTDAANFKAQLESLKSQVGFSVLQAMREASKTGGALGSISDMENKLLQANLAALDRAQSVPEFTASLKQIVDYTSGAKQRIKTAFNTKHAAAPTATPGGAAPRSFASGAALEAAVANGEVNPGDRIIVNGQSGVWR